ncbi:hypothetical protein H4R27_000738 [Coemansia aciculifera]|nr:hypothetical protein H4R27_000738 [Coemansia aciculifera]
MTGSIVFHTKDTEYTDINGSDIVWDRITSTYSAGTSAGTSAGDEGEKGEFMKELKAMLVEKLSMFPEIEQDDFMSNGCALIQDNVNDYNFTVLPDVITNMWMCFITASPKST